MYGKQDSVSVGDKTEKIRLNPVHEAVLMHAK